MGECTLDEIITAGCSGENCGCDGVRLRYRPQLQRAGVGALVEVQWPAAWPDSEWRLVEVFGAAATGVACPRGWPRTAFRKAPRSVASIPGRASFQAS